MRRVTGKQDFIVLLAESLVLCLPRRHDYYDAGYCGPIIDGLLDIASFTREEGEKLVSEISARSEPLARVVAARLENSTPRSSL
jgi:hypothetical protein